jgi:hypothetical protein
MAGDWQRHPIRKVRQESAFHTQLGRALFALGKAKQPPGIDLKNLKIPPFIQEFHMHSAELWEGSGNDVLCTLCG